MGVLGGGTMSASGGSTPVARAARAAGAGNAAAGGAAGGCNFAGAQSGGVGNDAQDMECDLQAPKRARTSSDAPRTTHSSSKTLQLPDTIESLLARLAVASESSEPSENPDKGSAARAGGANGDALSPLKGVPASSERAISMWQSLDMHKRSMVQNAVRADEERYRAEVCLRDAQIALEAAQQRRDSALCAASDTLTAVCPHHPCFIAPEYTQHAQLVLYRLVVLKIRISVYGYGVVSCFHLCNRKRCRIYMHAYLLT